MSAPPVAPATRQLPPPELSLYRDQCLIVLRRYFIMSVEAGRLPALLGREVFRARAHTYRLASFEDAVIFVHDVEQCLQRLSVFDRELIARVVFQEYTQEEAAALMGCARRTVNSRFPDALDCLTEMFISAGLLHPQTRHYRHPLADGARFDLQGGAPADITALVECNFLHATCPGGNVVKPPVDAIFAVST